MYRSGWTIRTSIRWALISAFTFLLSGGPVFAIKNTNSMLADPALYFPGCTCSAAFLSFVIWMIALLIIAMFQYGEKRERKLTAWGFSIIAIILAFIIYSIPLLTMVLMLKPASFNVNEETGKYEFSKYGEREELTGSYTKAELEDNILKSRTGVITSWVILGVVCAGAGAFFPVYLKQRAEKKMQAPPPRRRKRKSTGRIGTRTAKPKEKDGKKGKRK